MISAASNSISNAGLDALYDLVETADIVIQNFRPGTADRLGVGYDDLDAHNEELIYCDISAFGSTGPWSKRSGYDLLVQGMSGIMTLPARRMGILITGMWAAFGIVGAPYRRVLTGDGEYVELGMLDATVVDEAGRQGVCQRGIGANGNERSVAPYPTFEPADGHLNIACLNQSLWWRLCEAIDRSDLPEDDCFEENADRVEHMDALEAESRTRSKTERPTSGWTFLSILAFPSIPVKTTRSTTNGPMCVR